MLNKHATETSSYAEATKSLATFFGVERARRETRKSQTRADGRVGGTLESSPRRVPPEALTGCPDGFPWRVGSWFRGGSPAEVPEGLRLMIRCSIPIPLPLSTHSSPFFYQILSSFSHLPHSPNLWGTRPAGAPAPAAISVPPCAPTHCARRARVP